MGRYYVEGANPYEAKKEAEKLTKRNKCQTCGGPLYGYVEWKTKRIYVACKYEEHEGFSRLYQEPNQMTSTRRFFQMTENTALVKYHGVTSLTKTEAAEIISTVFPKAPEHEMARAILLCVTQHLNPLMGHVFLVPFNEGKENESWATVIGINAKRLMAARKGAFSYIDDTPRVMTDEEQIRRWGKVDTENLCTIVKLQDPKTGAIAPGYGKWPLRKKKWKDGKPIEVDNEPYGTEKGNSMFNMSSIRAESQALNRLRPGDMPEDVMVMDEAVAGAMASGGYVEGESRVIPEEELEPEPEPQPEPEEETAPEPEPKAAKETTEVAIDIDQLKAMMDVLHWKESTVISYLGSNYHVDKKGNLEDVIARLVADDQKKFMADMNNKVELAEA